MCFYKYVFTQNGGDRKESTSESSLESSSGYSSQTVTSNATPDEGGYILFILSLKKRNRI